MEEHFLTKRDKAVRIAQGEVVARECGVTQQVLSVHEVELGDDGNPVVARVAEGIKAGSYSVYFPIKDEPYFFVVHAGPFEQSEMTLLGTSIEARVRVYLAITSTTMTPEEITANIGFIPSETHLIGDPVTPKATLLKFQHHLWEIEPQRDLPGSVEEKIAFLLDAVKPVAARIAALKPACQMRVTVVFEGWGGDPQFGGFNFNEQIVAQLAEIGAELSFDLYSFGPQMLDEGFS